MSHPLKTQVSSVHNTKLRALTKGYGAASNIVQNITKPQDRNAVHGRPQPDVAFKKNNSVLSPRGEG